MIIAKKLKVVNQLMNQGFFQPTVGKCMHATLGMILSMIDKPIALH